MAASDLSWSVFYVNTVCIPVSSRGYELLLAETGYYDYSIPSCMRSAQEMLEEGKKEKEEERKT